MTNSQKKFCWYELMTTDPRAATEFYTHVVGWTAQEAPGGMPYTLLGLGERHVGGLMALPKEACDAGARPGWIGYIAVDDVDRAAREIQEAGGAIHKPAADIPGVGRFAVVADPQGAGFVLFTGNGEQTPLPPMTPGTTGWHELHAADGAKAFEFYARHFGWTKAEAMDMGAMGVYQIFAIDGQSAGGFMTKPPSEPRPFWLFYFVTKGIDAAIGRITEKGGKVLNGPMEVPGGAWIVQAHDPQGVLFALVGPRS